MQVIRAIVVPAGQGTVQSAIEISHDYRLQDAFPQGPPGVHIGIGIQEDWNLIALTPVHRPPDRGMSISADLHDAWTKPLKRLAYVGIVYPPEMLGIEILLRLEKLPLVPLEQWNIPLHLCPKIAVKVGFCSRFSAEEDLQDHSWNRCQGAVIRHKVLDRVAYYDRNPNWHRRRIVGDRSDFACEG